MEGLTPTNISHVELCKHGRLEQPDSPRKIKLFMFIINQITYWLSNFDYNSPMSNHHDRYIVHYSNNLHENNSFDYIAHPYVLSSDLIKILFIDGNPNHPNAHQSHTMNRCILFDIDINILENIQHMFHYSNMVDLHKHDYLKKKN